MASATPRSIEDVDHKALRITWEDGHVTELSARHLRVNCPCALCRDEWTGRRLVEPSSVPEDLKTSNAGLVGNYALTVAFSDGHGTGIYSFEGLRGLCACPQCARTGPAGA